MRNSTEAKKGKVFPYTADNLRPAIIVIREIKNHISDEPSVHFNLANMLGRQKIEFVVRDSGTDAGFFLGGGALVSCSTSTPINYIVFFFFLQNTSCTVLENRRSSQVGVRTPCTLPLDPRL